MNTKQHKLAEAMSREMKKRFPDLQITGIGHAWGESADAWIHIQFPSDHAQELAVRDFAAELSNKYLEKHDVLILPVSGSYHPASH
jgi:hypothetical protein